MRFRRHRVERSASSHAILDETSRQQKADKIAFVLSGHVDLARCRVLDVGTGSGHIAHALARHAASVVSVDVADERRIGDGYEFLQVVGTDLPFDDGCFDVVVSNHIIEHVDHQQAHVDQAGRVLTSDGILYLATPNKWWLTDPHYRIPFVSWLPRGLASQYLALVQGAEWDIHPLSDADVRRLLRGWLVSDELPRLIGASGDPSLDTSGPLTRLAARLPTEVITRIRHISPTLIVTARPPRDDASRTHP